MKVRSAIVPLLALAGAVYLPLALAGCHWIYPFSTAGVVTSPMTGSWEGKGASTGANAWSGDMQALLIQDDGMEIHGAFRTPQTFGKAPGQVPHDLGPTRYLVNGRNIVGENEVGVDLGYDESDGYFVLLAREPTKKGLSYPLATFIEHYLYAWVGVDTAAPANMKVAVERLNGASIGSFDLGELSGKFAAAPWSEEQVLHQPWLGEAALAKTPFVVDPRFFGTYHGSATVTVDVPYETTFLGIVTGGGTKTETLKFEHIQLDLVHRGAGALPFAGVVSGSGRARVDGHWFGFVLSGEVVSKGLMRATGSARTGDTIDVNGHNVYPMLTGTGYTWLANDGRTLTTQFLGNTVVLKKDAAPFGGGAANTAPTVKITKPANGSTFDYGAPIAFEAQVTDAESGGADKMAALSWESAYGGVFGKSIPKKPSGFETRDRVTWDQFASATHVITFSATDPGGLTGTHSITIAVNGQKPQKPEIQLPLAGTDLYTGTAVTFQGTGYDVEDGMSVYDKAGVRVSGPKLTWSSDRETWTGAEGTEIQRSLTATGTHTITLTATDSEQQTAQVSETYVVKVNEGKTPPVVVIVSPDPKAFGGSSHAIRGTPIKLRALASDGQDPARDLKLEWRIVKTSVGSSEPDFVKLDTLAFDHTFADITVEIRTYRVTIVVTDTDGMQGSAGIDLVVFPKGFTIY